MQINLKTPISYYGGKQQMLRHIMPNIPEHEIYTESFVGGGAVYWAKKPAQLEVINDLSREVVNFYEVLKLHNKRLQYYINGSLHSRSQYADAMVMYEHPQLFTKVERAWAFWVLTNFGFSTMIGSWGFDKNGKQSTKLNNKKLQNLEEMSKRLERTTIECNDACRVLSLFDGPNTFHYIDPPYINVNQGHYSGYTEHDYLKLLECISHLKGKFILSSYPSEILTKFVKLNGWKSVEYIKQLCASGKAGKTKTEVITANFELIK